MKKLLLSTAVCLFPFYAFAQGFPSAVTPLTGADGVIICKTCSTPPTNATKEFVAPLSALSAFVQSQLPLSSGPVQVAIVVGNSTGSYSVPGITAANKLLLGIAVEDTLASFALVGSTINATNGWVTGAGTITDPADIDWSNFSIIWLYQ